MSCFLSYCKTHFLWMVLCLGVSFGLMSTAQAAANRDVLFICSAWVPSEDYDSDKDEGYVISVRGRVHENGVLHNPIFVDIDGHVIARYSGASYSTGRGHLQIEGIRSGRLGGRLVLRYMGENSSLNYFYYSPDPHTRSFDRSLVDTRDFECRFRRVW